MLTVCRDLRMISVVEGVEHAERDVLIALGAEMFKYVFAKPARLFPTPVF